MNFMPFYFVTLTTLTLNTQTLSGHCGDLLTMHKVRSVSQSINIISQKQTDRHSPDTHIYTEIWKFHFPTHAIVKTLSCISIIFSFFQFEMKQLNYLMFKPILDTKTITNKMNSHPFGRSICWLNSSRTSWFHHLLEQFGSGILYCS